MSNTMESDSEIKLKKIRHTLAHLMAQAVLEFYPTTKLGIGPPISDGFYFDFQFGDASGNSVTVGAEDLPKIESRMRELVKEKHAVTYKEVSEAEARQIFADQPFKLELIDDLTNEDGSPTLSVYQQDLSLIHI